MNHTGIVEHESERVYRERAFILHKLDDQHFEALNPEGHVLGLNGYCLDALDHMPAGGMEEDAPGPVFHSRGYSNRGRQLEICRGLTMENIREREALAARLIAEILAEEAHTTTNERAS